MAVVTITKENFTQEVMNATQKVLIDFYADWCGPCKMVSPIVDEIAEEQSETKICKVNVDEQPSLAQMFGVSSIPTLAVVEKGQLLKREVGAKSKEAILAMLK